MSILRTKLFDVPRPTLLLQLARGITELTIRSRYYYDQPDGKARLVEGNEAIHRLNGHLRDLLDPNEELTESRKDGIVEQLCVLSPPALDRIFSQRT